MPIMTYGGFKRMTGFCKTKVPQEMADALEAIKDNEEACKVWKGVEGCGRGVEGVWKGCGRGRAGAGVDLAHNGRPQSNTFPYPPYPPPLPRRPLAWTRRWACARSCWQRACRACTCTR